MEVSTSWNFIKSILLFHFIGFRGHNRVQLGVLREAVNKRQNDIAVKQKPLALAGMGHIGELMGADIELLGQDLPIPASLVEHIHEVAVFKDVLHLSGS